jgi:hypothetical protein
MLARPFLAFVALVVFMGSVCTAVEVKQGAGQTIPSPKPPPPSTRTVPQNDTSKTTPNIKPPPLGTGTGSQNVDTNNKPKTGKKLPSCETVISDCVDKCPDLPRDPQTNVRRISPGCLAACRASASKGRNCT